MLFYKKKINFEGLKEVSTESLKITSMVFFILIGASIFSLVFRGFGGDRLVEDFLTSIPGGPIASLVLVMITIFFMGFFLDFLEIIFVIVPIVAPTLISMGFDPVWLGIIIAVNIQTSFLTPPFGFALFYFRGVATKIIKTSEIYKGVFPSKRNQFAIPRPSCRSGQRQRKSRITEVHARTRGSSPLLEAHHQPRNPRM